MRVYMVVLRQKRKGVKLWLDFMQVQKLSQKKGMDFLEGLNLWRLNYEGSGEVDGVKFSHDDMGDCYLYMNEEDETFGLFDTYE